MVTIAMDRVDEQNISIKRTVFRQDDTLNAPSSPTEQVTNNTSRGSSEDSDSNHSITHTDADALQTIQNSINQIVQTKNENRIQFTINYKPKNINYTTNINHDCNRSESLDQENRKLKEELKSLKKTTDSIQEQTNLNLELILTTVESVPGLVDAYSKRNTTENNVILAKFLSDYRSRTLHTSKKVDLNIQN